MNNILSLKDLCKSYGNRKVVNNLNLSVTSGESIGFLGPNGAGKSTTIKLISGIENPDGGNIFYNDTPVSQCSKKFKSILGVVPQDISFYDDLSTYDNASFFCSLYGFKGSELKRRVEETLSFVGLWDRKDDRPKDFSGGMKRRLNIACSIAHSPEILILDEPTVGIDPQSRNYILEALKKLNEKGTTIIYVSHYMEEIEAICNRIVIMDNGNKIVDQSKNSLKECYKDSNLNSLEEIFLHLTGTALREED